MHTGPSAQCRGQARRVGGGGKDATTRVHYACQQSCCSAVIILQCHSHIAVPWSHCSAVAMLQCRSHTAVSQSCCSAMVTFSVMFLLQCHGHASVPWAGWLAALCTALALLAWCGLCHGVSAGAGCPVHEPGAVPGLGRGVYLFDFMHSFAIEFLHWKEGRAWGGEEKTAVLVQHRAAPTTCSSWAECWG